MSSKLSVIIPMWNVEAFIAETLDSIIASTYSDFIVWVVDDICTDNSRTIVESYSMRDPRIRIVSRDRNPKGAQTCRNIGFECSEGSEYVMWLDSDDIISSTCFQHRVEYMEEHKELDFAVFPARAFCDRVNNLTDVVFGVEHDKSIDLHMFFRRQLPFVGWTNIYRRSSLVRYGMSWDERILSLQDSDFNIQSILNGVRYEYAGGDYDYYWRTMSQSNSITSKIASKEHIQSHVYFINKQVSSLSFKLRKSVSFAIDDYILFLADKVKYDKSFISAIKESILKNRFLFSTRLSIVAFFEKKWSNGYWIKNVFFPLLYIYNRYYQHVYRRNVKKYIYGRMDLNTCLR